MSLKYQILTRFNHVHVKRHDKWRETMKIDFKTSNIVVQYVFKKIMLIWKGVDIVSCCVNCQCVIYVILCIKSSVSGECCIRYYTLVSLATVYPKTYAHGFCFAVLFCGYILTDFPISIRLTSLPLWQSNDCPSASKATLMNMDKYFMWIHYERLHNHNKAKHNKTVCVFLGIYCIGKENACRLSKVLYESVAWNLLRYVILRVHPIKMR